jgi:hypothetical protein
MQRYIDFILTKIAGGACVGLPFIIIFNQFFNSAFTSWVQIILSFYIFAFLGTKIYMFNRTLSGIRSGRQWPKPYANHPIYQTNTEEYEIVADKVRDFICAVLKGDLTSLKITGDEMNCIRLCGLTREKSGSFGLPEHYRICEDKIIINTLVFFPFSSDIFVPFVNKISFTLEEDEWKEINDINGPDLGLKKGELVSSSSSLSNSVLLERLFAGSQCISFNGNCVLSIIGSIKYVGVKKNQFILSNYSQDECDE